ncbi:hypothetical protein QLZ26_14485 [Cronobacter universalis]|nr:hypothetical protein [Cronobacter universalis]
MKTSSASFFTLAEAAPEHDRIRSEITLPLVNKVPLPRDTSVGMVGFPGWQGLVRGKQLFPEFRKTDFGFLLCCVLHSYLFEKSKNGMM